jgi:phospholipase/lecithinase/hemolysin
MTEARQGNSRGNAMSSISNPTKVFALAACMTGALLGVSKANASLYTAEYVFGDSLSDNGNLAAGLHTSFPDPPSFNNSFTNGPVAVARLAQALGLPLNPSLWTTGALAPAGTNYAVGGAQAADSGDGIDLTEQVGAFSFYSHGAADPAALYVIMIGGNDVRNAALPGGGGLPAVQDGVNTEIKEITALSTEGAKNFLVVNVPNVGLIPEFTQDPTLPPGTDANATTYSRDYDSLLSSGLATLDPTLPTGTSLTEFDLYAFNTQLLAEAPNLGFTNTRDPCFTQTPFSAVTTTDCGVNGANIGSFVYWDQIHPTARVHAYWAQAFGEALGVTVVVPELSTWAAMLIGFLGLGLAGYRNARQGRDAAQA